MESCVALWKSFAEENLKHARGGKFINNSLAICFPAAHSEALTTKKRAWEIVLEVASVLQIDEIHFHVRRSIAWIVKFSPQTVIKRKNRGTRKFKRIFRKEHAQMWNFHETFPTFSSPLWKIYWLRRECQSPLLGADSRFEILLRFKTWIELKSQSLSSWINCYWISNNDHFFSSWCVHRLALKWLFMPLGLEKFNSNCSSPYTNHSAAKLLVCEAIMALLMNHAVSVTRTH